MIEWMRLLFYMLPNILCSKLHTTLNSLIRLFVIQLAIKRRHLFSSNKTVPKFSTRMSIKHLPGSRSSSLLASACMSPGVDVPGLRVHLFSSWNTHISYLNKTHASVIWVTHTHTRTHARTHARTHTHTRTRTRTHTHTHTHTPVSWVTHMHQLFELNTHQ